MSVLFSTQKPSRGTLGSNTPLSYDSHPAQELLLPYPDEDNSLPGPPLPSLNCFLIHLPEAWQGDTIARLSLNYSQMPG